MIKFITVWVLTVSYVSTNQKTSYSYQLQYADQKTCVSQIKNHTERYEYPDAYFGGKLLNANKSPAVTLFKCQW